MKRQGKHSKKSRAAVEGSPARNREAPRGPMERIGWRKWLFRLGAMLVVPLVLLASLEVVLRVARYGYDPGFFLERRIEGEAFLVQNDAFSLRFFPPQTIRHPGALRMRAAKAEGSIRIFVLGESAAMGDPEPAFGPARYMEVMLRERYPEVEFEIVNVAFTAINSHVILPLARECADHEGDIWIVYMGNNEMVGPYGAVTVFGAQSPPRRLVKLSLSTQRARLGQLGRAISRQLQKPATEDASWGGMRMFMDNRVPPTSPKRERVYRNFEGNLREIVETGLDAGARVILNTVAVNLRHSPPFASVANESLTESARRQFTALFDRGRSAEAAGDFAEAAAAFQEALTLDATFAEAHYRLGSCLEELSDMKLAGKHYQLACNSDGLPFRTDSRLNERIRIVSQDYDDRGVHFLDAETLLPVRNGEPVSGRESFYEHVHFNFAGGYQLGSLWAEAVEASLSEGQTHGPVGDWPTRERCDRLLGLTDWNRKLVTEAVVRRLQEPPLSSQFNSPDRFQRLRDHEKLLLSRMKASAVYAAKVVYDEAIALRPEYNFLHEVYGNFLQATGDQAGAIRAWESAARLLPHDFLPWFQVGLLQARQGDHSQAQQHLLKALELQSSLVEGWSELGQSYGIQRQWEPALDAFRQACALRPQDPLLWAYQAKTLASMGRTEEALALYFKAIELRPGYWEAHGALGDLYAHLDRVPEAINAYETAVKMKPDYLTAHLNLGVMLVRQGQTGEGVRKFQEVLQLDPGNEAARNYLEQTETIGKQKR